MRILYRGRARPRQKPVKGTATPLPAIIIHFLSTFYLKLKPRHPTRQLDGHWQLAFDAPPSRPSWAAITKENRHKYVEGACEQPVQHI